MPRRRFENKREELIYRFLDLLRNRRQMTKKEFHEAHIVIRSACLLAGYQLPGLDDEEAIVQLKTPPSIATEIIKEAAGFTPEPTPPAPTLLSDLQEKSS